MSENQIVVYQPDGTMRLDVRLENETVWLTQSQMGELFRRDVSVISRHIKNVFAEGELRKEGNLHFLQIASADKPVAFYSLDVIISVGYRVKSMIGTRFRQWANMVLKEYLLRGYTVNGRLNQIEDRIDRRLEKHDARLSALEDKVDFFVQTRTPPLQGVFYDGQLWDACSLVEKLVGRAKKSILLVDSWVGPGTLDLLAKKRKGVKVRIVASAKGNKLAPSDIDKFNAQYGGLSVRENGAFHDRFLVLDDKELYLVGASLKDLGKKCFAFARMDAAEIPGIVARSRD
ncbi:MAG: virulence RhuM family protein [Kiritimatiellae bacterium]|nr:virulence RhuM family protein [Kiritimatiellia bacterium]